MRMEKFGKILFELRRQLKISQQQLAGYVDVTQQCISEWERGITEPTLTNLCRLADVFNVSIDLLAGRMD